MTLRCDDCLHDFTADEDRFIVHEYVRTSVAWEHWSTTTRKVVCVDCAGWYRPVVKVTAEEAAVRGV